MRRLPRQDCTSCSPEFKQKHNADERHLIVPRVCSQMAKLGTFSRFGACEDGPEDVARRPMEANRAVVLRQGRRARGNRARQPPLCRSGVVDRPHGLAVVRPAPTLRRVAHGVHAFFPLEQERGVGTDGRRTQERCRSGAVVRRLDHRASPPTRDRRPKKAGAQAIGRSRGGLSTKIHAAVEALGNPLRLRLTAGQMADMTEAAALIKGIEAQSVIAGKGYDADTFVDTIETRGAQAVIPPRSNRLTQPAYDRHL